MDVCHLFAQGMLAFIPLIDATEPVLDIEGGLFFALWLSLAFRGQGLYPSCWSSSPQMFLSCISVARGRWDWSTPSRRGIPECLFVGPVHL